MTAPTLARIQIDWRAATIGRLASDCLRLEVETYPKPGLVSQYDTGSHADMDIDLMLTSALTLEPWFARLAALGLGDAEMADLRAAGVAAEIDMLRATRGINTHRGAIFGLGLLAAAAGLRARRGVETSLGALVANRWGEAILDGPLSTTSHGGVAARLHGAGGARAQAAGGFRAIYDIALPALRHGRHLSGGEEEAARAQACMALIASVDDTNLLHRGGPAGLVFARACAKAFIARGGVGRADWRARAVEIHRAFVRRNLSPGGCADLLAFALFVERIEG